jgi:hypothetical protein
MAHRGKIGESGRKPSVPSTLDRGILIKVVPVRVCSLFLFTDRLESPLQSGPLSAKTKPSRHDINN